MVFQGKSLSVFQNHLLHLKPGLTGFRQPFQLHPVAAAGLGHRILDAVDHHPFRLVPGGVAAFKPQDNGLVFVEHFRCRPALSLRREIIKGELVVDVQLKLLHHRQAPAVVLVPFQFIGIPVVLCGKGKGVEGVLFQVQPKFMAACWCIPGVHRHKFPVFVLKQLHLGGGQGGIRVG